MPVESPVTPSHMPRTFFLPGFDREPQDADRRAGWRRATALADHFAQAAWTLSDPPLPPTPVSLAGMHPWERALTEQAHAELTALSPSDDDRREALEEVEKASNALKGAKARLYVQQCHVLQTLCSVAEPDRDFESMSTDDALQTRVSPFSEDSAGQVRDRGSLRAA